MTTVSVRILDKEYQVRCPEDEVDTLTQSARHLDKTMSEIKDGGKVVGVDRIAVMAALNIASELFSKSAAEAALSEEVEQTVSRLTERLTSTLAEHKQLDL
ncbi:MAG: cell division protein ZapA [Pseudomonadaceae bacterium]|nr:cell division protein ZapA [Pseudomonadaceae bacterium]